MKKIITAKIPYPPPPEWLSEGAQAKWLEIVPHINTLLVDLEKHADLIAMYCEAYARWREALDNLKLGSTVIDKDDRVTPSPYVGIRDKAVSEMREIGRQIGLHPGGT